MKLSLSSFLTDEPPITPILTSEKSLFPGHLSDITFENIKYQIISGVVTGTKWLKDKKEETVGVKLDLLTTLNDISYISEIFLVDDKKTNKLAFKNGLNEILKDELSMLKNSAGNPIMLIVKNGIKEGHYNALSYTFEGYWEIKNKSGSKREIIMGSISNVFQGVSGTHFTMKIKKDGTIYHEPFIVPNGSCNKTDVFNALTMAEYSNVNSIIVANANDCLKTAMKLRLPIRPFPEKLKKSDCIGMAMDYEDFDCSLSLNKQKYSNISFDR